MPRDASGNYSLPIGNPVTSDTVIESDWANSTMEDIALQLNNVITRDGSLGPIGVFKLADGTVGTPGLGFVAESGLGLYRPSQSVLGFSSGGRQIGGLNMSNAASTMLTLYPRTTTPGSGSSGFTVSLQQQGAVDVNYLSMFASNDAMHISSLATGAPAALALDIDAPTLNVNAAQTNFSGGAHFGVQPTGITFPQVVKTDFIQNLRPPPNPDSHAIYIGFIGGRLDLQVDSSYFGAHFPMDITGASATIGNAASLDGARLWFTWSDPGGQRAYLWGGDSPAGQVLTYTSSMDVRNSGMVSGIGPWRYANLNGNYAYLWMTNGSANDNFLSTPASIQVDNANRLQGMVPGNFIQAIGSVTAMWNNGGGQLLARIGGYGDVYWGVNLSDEKLKTNIVPTAQDSLSKIKKINFRAFDWKTSLPRIVTEDLDPPTVVPVQVRGAPHAPYKVTNADQAKVAKLSYKPPAQEPVGPLDEFGNPVTPPVYLKEWDDLPSEPPPPYVPPVVTPTTFKTGGGSVKLGVLAAEMAAIDPEWVPDVPGATYKQIDPLPLIMACMQAIQQIVVKLEEL